MSIFDYNDDELANNYVLISDLREYEKTTVRFMTEGEESVINQINAVISYSFIINGRHPSLMFLVLAPVAMSEDGSYKVYKFKDLANYYLKWDCFFKNGEFEILSYDVMDDIYGQRVEQVLGENKVSPDVVKIRRDSRYDQFRYEDDKDDIQVTFFAGDASVRSEVMWVKTTGYSEEIKGALTGRLLNEPNSSAFGVKEGDIVTFALMEKYGLPFPVALLKWMMDGLLEE